MRVSCSPVNLATWATGIAAAKVISNASNSSVNPDSGRAQLTATCRTPCSGQRTRGTFACKWAWYWKKSKCRHVLASVSCTGHASSVHPGSGHGNRAPRGYSRYRSSRAASLSNSDRATRHGTASPNAVVNSSCSTWTTLRPAH